MDNRNQKDNSSQNDGIVYFLSASGRRVPKSEIIVTISEYLQEIERVHGKPNKIKVCRKLFTYLVDHKSFVEAYSRFYEVIKKKMIEFSKDGVDCHLEYRALFGENLPGYHGGYNLRPRKR